MSDHTSLWKYLTVLKTANITVVGLIFDLTGALLIYFFAIQSYQNCHIELDVYGQLQVEHVSQEQLDLREKNIRLSKIGLGLLVIGFIFQIIGNLWPEN